MPIAAVLTCWRLAEISMGVWIMAQPGSMAEDVKKPGRGHGWRQAASWFFGLLVLTALVSVVLHFGEIGNFARLAMQVRPAWLLVALVLQAGTYVCETGVWYATLAAAHQSRTLKSLVPLGLAKLFADQAFPSAGLTGVIIVIRGLGRRGIAPELAMAVLLADMLAFYTAYLLSVVASLVLLWLYHDLNRFFLGAALLFFFLAIGIPLCILWLLHQGGNVPLRLRRLVPLSADLLDALRRTPVGLLRKPALAACNIFLQLMIFLLDAATLWLMLVALGVQAAPLTVFSSFIIAAMAAALGPIPSGLGTFEAVCVGMLKMLGTPLEAALTATMLFRGLTFWLPMLPGIWIARRETE